MSGQAIATSEAEPQPANSPGSWIGSADYPAAALKAHAEGGTSFRLTIAADGTISACTVTQSSGSADLDSATCMLLRQRARFSPARDADGHPVAGTYASRIRWAIPAIHQNLPAGGGLAPPHLVNQPITADDYPAVPALSHGSGTTFASIFVTPDGHPIRCSVTAHSGFPQLDETTCDRFMKIAQFEPATDEAGHPAYGVYRTSVRWLMSYDNLDLHRFVEHEHPQPDDTDVTVGIRHMPAGLVSPAKVELAIMVDDTGKITRCIPEASPAGIALGALACTQMETVWKPAPVLDGQDKPVSSVQTVKVGFHFDPGH